MKRLTADQIRSLATTHVAVDESQEKLSTTQLTLINMFTEFGIACMNLAEQKAE